MRYPVIAAGRELNINHKTKSKMTPFAVTFTNQYGKQTVVVFASDEGQAIKQAIERGTVTIFSKVEASVILNPIEGKSIAIKQP